MANYIIQDSTLNAIGDAIRSKTGKSDSLSPAQMVDEINNLSAEEIIKSADIPEYVKKEALRVANKVESVRESDSIVFLAMSDNHHYGVQKDSDQYPSSDGIQNNESNLHAAMAAKTLAYALKLDFIAQLGDITWGNSLTTSDLLHDQSDELVSWLRESHNSIPCFHAIGNHDSGYYYHRQQINDGNTGVYTEPGSWLYDNFTALSDSTNTVFGGAANGGYCYRDFPDKKLRVFLLNTSEALVANQTDGATLASQRQWFADALVNLNSKSDASSWKFIVLSHYPADYGNTMPLSELLKAYVNGTSITITSTVNFSGKNSAKMIAQFHGHIHNFLTSKLYSYATGNGVTYNAWRVATPNIQYNRENYYSIVGSYTDIDFSEPVSCSKTASSATDTSFVINVINPSEQMIHSICYGAGRDRVIGYGSTEYHTVYTNLNNVTISTAMTNGIATIQGGQSFTATLTPSVGSITEVTVKMGATVLSGAYSNGTITIPSVTDNVYIYAKAERVLACRNWIPLSTTSTGEIYNGVGYKANTYIQNGADSSATAIYSTGFIPIQNGDIVRFKNMSFTSGQSNYRIAFYNSSYGFIGHMAANGSYLMDTTLKGVKDSDGNYTQFTMNTTHANSKNAVFIRICCANITSESIVTVNEEIKYLDELESVTMYSVSFDNQYVVQSNNEKMVKEGQSYTNTFTAYAGYALDGVKVTMGGTDITSTAYSNYKDSILSNPTSNPCSSGTITIPSVNGNIVITSKFIEISLNNVLPLSTDVNGHYYGFKANTYLSEGIEGSRDDIYTTGFIPCQIGDKLYCKNVGMQTGQDSHRLCWYDANKTYIGTVKTNVTAYSGWHYGSDGNIDVLTIGKSGDNSATAYIRLCCGYLGVDSIITVNEPIE